MNVDKILVEGTLRGCRRLLNVEYVATDKQRVRSLLDAQRLELVEEMLMLIDTIVVLIDDLTYMKVGDVDYFHRENKMFKCNNIMCE